MNIFDRFKEIIKDSNYPVIFEFGTCEGNETNKMCTLLRKTKSSFRYYAFEADPRIMPAFKQRNAHNFDFLTFVPKAIGNKDGNVKFYLSSGVESREEHGKGQSFYGSSSIRQPKEVLNIWPDMAFNYTLIESIKFDTYYQQLNIGIIDLVWADVQGAEVDLILGGQRALSNTRYLYTEYYDQELYKGEIGLSEIIKILPGKWVIVEDYGTDVLLKNENL